LQNTTPKAGNYMFGFSRDKLTMALTQ